MTENPKLRQGRAQEAWQRALGMRSFGADRADAALVQVVSDSSTADLPIRGNVFTGRVVSPAFAGTHSYVRFFNKWGFRMIMINAFNSPPIQMCGFAGGGIANLATVDLFTLNQSDSYYGRDGDERSFSTGPDFGINFPNDDPIQIQTLTAGQRGPIIIEGTAVAGTLGTWKVPPPGMIVYPLTPGGLADLYFLGQVINSQIDIQFMIELPLRYPLRAAP